MKQGTHKGCPYSVYMELRYLIIKKTTKSIRMAQVAHVAPLGLGRWDIPSGYKHVAPPGLKTHYPISLCFRVSLVPMEDNHKLSVAKSRFIGEVTPTGMSPIPVGCWNGRGNPAPTQQSMDFQ